MQTIPSSGNASVTQLTSGSVVFDRGTNSNYTLSALNSEITISNEIINSRETNNARLGSVNTAVITMRVVKRNGAKFEVTLVQPIQNNGHDSPSSGIVKIATTQADCSPIVLTYKPDSKFDMTCGGNTLNKSWADADIQDAQKAAIR